VSTGVISSITNSVSGSYLQACRKAPVKSKQTANPINRLTIRFIQALGLVLVLSLVLSRSVLALDEPEFSISVDSVATVW